MPPLGDMNIVDIIPILSEEVSRSDGFSLKFINIDEDAYQEIEENYPNNFAFARDEFYDECIYDIKDFSLTLLDDNYKYEVLTQSHKEDCLDLLDRLGNNIDVEAVCFIFEQFKNLGISGGCVYNEKQLVGLIIGSPINNRCFCIHYELVDQIDDGLSLVLNTNFVTQLPNQYELINSRFIKNYSPLIKHNYLALKLSRQEKESHDLWTLVFGDERKHIDAYFAFYHKKENHLIVEEDGRVAGMLYLPQFKTEIGVVSYVYALAVHPDFRSKGYASVLMKKAMEVAVQRGDNAILYIPAEESLKDFCKRFNYEDAEIKLNFNLNEDFDFGTGDKDMDIAMIWSNNDYSGVYKKSLDLSFI